MVDITENAKKVENVKENKLGRYALSFFLKVVIEAADRTSSGSSFHILGASYAKLRPNFRVA